MAELLPWQQSIWLKLQERIQQQRLPHALLLHGQEGSGKGHFALLLAKNLLCQQPEDSDNSCPSCKLFEAGTHPDFKVLQPEEDKTILAIDQVREMVLQFSYTPQISSRQVVVVNPAESMNVNAANSLLKTLEEPAGDGVIILVSHAPASLLPTIRSRCQQLAFPPPSRTEALDWLQQRLGNKSEMALRLAEGAPLRALALAESSDHYQQMGDELIALLRGSANPIRVAIRWSKLDTLTTLRWLQQWVVAIIREGGEGVAVEPLLSLTKLLQPVDRKRIFLFYDKLIEAIAISTTAINKELLFEGILIEWSSFR